MKREYCAVKEGACPYCGKRFNSASTLRCAARPKPGDWSVCIECAAVLVFSDDLSMRKPTEQESQQSTRIPGIFQMQMMVRARLAAKSGRRCLAVGRA